MIASFAGSSQEFLFQLSYQQNHCHKWSQFLYWLRNPIRKNAECQPFLTSSQSPGFVTSHTAAFPVSRQIFVLRVASRPTYVHIYVPSPSPHPQIHSPIISKLHTLQEATFLERCQCQKLAILSVQLLRT